MQVYTTDTHLVGNAVNAEFGIVQIVVDGYHDALQQFFVGRFHLDIFYQLLQLVVAAEFQLQRVVRVDEVDDGTTQNVHVEWLDDIGVGACLQAFQLVFFATLGRQQNDGDVVGGVVRLDLRTERGTIHLWHHNI